MHGLCHLSLLLTNSNVYRLLMFCPRPCVILEKRSFNAKISWPGLRKSTLYYLIIRLCLWSSTSHYVLCYSVYDSVENGNAAYMSLVQSLKENGSLLKQQDKENYKKSLKDLKDYSIYKDVMETAMVKMQTELDELVLENKVTIFDILT